MILAVATFSWLFLPMAFSTEDVTEIEYVSGWELAAGPGIYCEFKLKSAGGPGYDDRKEIAGCDERIDNTFCVSSAAECLYLAAQDDDCSDYVYHSNGAGVWEDGRCFCMRKGYECVKAERAHYSVYKAPGANAVSPVKKVNDPLEESCGSTGPDVCWYPVGECAKPAYDMDECREVSFAKSRTDGVALGVCAGATVGVEGKVVSAEVSLEVCAELSQEVGTEETQTVKIPGVKGTTTVGCVRGLEINFPDKGTYVSYQATTFTVCQGQCPGTICSKSPQEVASENSPIPPIEELVSVAGRCDAQVATYTLMGVLFAIGLPRF